MLQWRAELKIKLFQELDLKSEAYQTSKLLHLESTIPVVDVSFTPKTSLRLFDLTSESKTTFHC